VFGFGSGFVASEIEDSKAWDEVAIGGSGLFMGIGGTWGLDFNSHVGRKRSVSFLGNGS
jgi:hypothetical protein